MILRAISLVRLAGALTVLGFLIVGISPVSAEVIVRSGEHKGFSRLVFTIKPPAPWGIIKDKSGYILSIDSNDKLASMSRIFKFIPRNRLTSIIPLEGTRGSYLLSVAKNFHAEAYEISPGKLVVDIKPGGRAPPDKPLVMHTPNIIEKVVQHAPPELPEPRVQQDILQPQIQQPIRRKESRISPRVPDAPTSLPNLVEKQSEIKRPRNQINPLENIAVLQAQEILVHQLSRAMTQGLTTHRSGGNAFEGAPKTSPLAKLETVSGELASQASDIPYLDHLNLDAQTVFDREISDRIARSPSNSGAIGCLRDSDLDVASWVPQVDRNSAVADLRSGLTGEFDKINVENLTALVRIYVAEGFGVEAQALMKDFKEIKIENAPLLYELAHVIEVGSLANSKVLGRQANCQGSAAMWSILARPVIAIGETPDSKNLTDNFAKLPVDMRRRIGPRLGTKLLKAGFTESAESIERVISRAPGKDGPTVELFRARIDLVRNRIDRARTRLLGLVDEDDPNAPEAMLLLINTYLKGPIQVPENLLTDVSARAFELRRGKLGEKLLHAELMALAKQKRHMTAFEVLAHASELEVVSPQKTSELAGEIFLAFDLKNLNAAQFTRTFFRFRNLISPSPNFDQTRRHIANALFEAGLPGVALAELKPLSGRMTDRDHEIYGKIYLSTGNPTKTLATLSQVQSAIADALRIQAFSALKKYGRAFAVASKQNTPTDPEVLALAWRAGEWRTVAAGDKTSRGYAAAYKLSDQRTVPTPGFAIHLQSPHILALGALDNLLTQSRASREVLKNLLAENPRP